MNGMGTYGRGSVGIYREAPRMLNAWMLNKESVGPRGTDREALRNIGSEAQVRGVGSGRAGMLLAKVLLAGGLGLLAGACALTGAAKVVDLYDISAPDVAALVRGGTRAQILVPEPTAVQALNTNRIVVRTGTSTLGYIGGAQWADSLPKLIQARLVESFEQSGRVGAVGTPGEGLFINYSIRLNVRFFGLDTDRSRQARIDFGAKILNESNGRVVASKSFRQAVPAGQGTQGAVDALDQAFGAVIKDLMQWLFSKI